MVVGALENFRGLLYQRNLLLLAVYSSLSIFAYAGFSNLLPALLTHLGVSREVIGPLFSLERLLVFMLAILMLYLSLHIGGRVLYLMPFITVLYGILLQVFASSNSVIVISILTPLITGLYLSLRPLNRSLINLLVDVKTLGLYVGLLSSISVLSSAMSSMLYGFLLQRVGLQEATYVILLFVAFMLITQVMLIRSVIKAQQYPKHSIESVKLSERILPKGFVLRDFVLLVSALSQLVEAGIAVYISVALWDILRDFSVIGFAISISYISNVILSPFMGHLSDKISKPLYLMGISLCILASSYHLLALGYSIPWLAFIALILSTTASTLFSPNIQIYVKKLSIMPQLYFSSLEFMGSLTGMLAPLLASIIIANTNLQNYLTLMAISELIFGITLITKAFLSRKGDERQKFG
jgi:MFS family permease